MQKNKMQHWLLPSSIEQSRLILKTYKSIVGESLFDEGYSDEYRAYLLYHAPFVVVSHGTERDPIFNYANLTAQQLWQIDWDDFTALPSRLSAEAVCVEDRQRLLDEASKKGFINNYEGVRIASTGKRFRIEKVLLWNLMSDDNLKKGQAALFRTWTNL
jgi:hypothetical protein